MGIEHLSDEDRARLEGYHSGRQFLKLGTLCINPYSYRDNEPLHLSWRAGYDHALDWLTMALRLNNNVWLVPFSEYVRLEKMEGATVYVSFKTDSLNGRYPYSVTEIRRCREEGF